MPSDSNGKTISDTLRIYNQRKKAIEYLKQWVGTPYLIGGDDFSGFDCNGIIHEVLQSVGIEKRGYDATAHGIYLEYKAKKVEKGCMGCLVFWFKNGKAVHVAMMIDNESIIHAAGGGFDTKTQKDAILHNAYVRMDSLNYRGDEYKIVDPFKE